MKVLVIGGGGREHALCWKLRRSPEVEELYCAPGNPGIAAVADCVPIAADEVHELADFAAELHVDLTVVGPELPLTLGLADEFRRRGLPVFGPSQRAAEIEGSKVFAKQFMERNGIPTAQAEVVHDADAARAAAKRFGFPVVVKVDGLAAGKGVMIASDREELDSALTTVFEERRFGAGGDRALIEEFLEGEEVSFIALSDGERVLPLATSKDYKRIGDGDTGPNTGGMGCHSPSGVLSPGEAAAILDSVLRPAVDGLAAEGRRYIGFLYAGIIVTADGPRVLEFNARLGDPEAQAVLLRLEDDLAPLLAAGAGGEFPTRRLAFSKEAAACIVLANQGYPGKHAQGEPIEGLDAAARLEGVEIFHAGTAERDGRIVASGGRVFGVCALGPRLVDALRRAYAAAAEIQWPSKVLRRDIGRRVLERETDGSSSEAN
jgi:phosphoribosylamine--glycine ligase